MKLMTSYYDKIQNRPMHKFFLNLFFLKNNAYFSLKQIMYIQIFYNIKNSFQIKLFKFNHTFYDNFVLYFIATNIATQVVLLLLIIDFNNEN